MEFIETSVFTETIKDLMSDETYAGLQHYLVLCPQAGVIIPQTGGLRKIRWKGYGKGKRGGVRVIYYWVRTDETILLLYAYPKSRQANLTRQQMKQLRDIIKKDCV